MPTVILPLSDTEATIDRSITKSVISQIIATSGFSTDNIIYSELGEVAHQPSSYPDDENGHLRMESGRYVIVDAISKVVEEIVPNKRTTQDQVPPIVSKQLGISLTPNSLEHEFEFTIRLRSKSRDEMSQWLTRFRSSRGVTNQHHYHDINYTYSVPNSIMAYLLDVGKIHATHTGSNLTPLQFIDSINKSGNLFRSNVSGKDHVYLINNHVHKVLGSYESVPENVTVNKELGYAEIELTYLLTIKKPISLTFEYQNIVCNKYMDSMYTEHFTMSGVEYRKDPYNFTLDHQVIAINEDKPAPAGKIQLDIFYDSSDKWYPEYLNKRLTVLKQVPLTLTPGSNVLFTMTDLVDAGIVTDRQKDNLVSLSQLLNEPTQSLFGLAVYSVGEMEHHIPLEIVGDTISSTVALDECNRHYLLLTFLNDVSWLNAEAMHVLSTEPEAFKEYLDIVNPDNSLTIPPIPSGETEPLPLTIEEVFTQLQLVPNTAKIVKRQEPYWPLLVAKGLIEFRRMD